MALLKLNYDDLYTDSTDTIDFDTIMEDIELIRKQNRLGTSETAFRKYIYSQEIFYRAIFQREFIGEMEIIKFNNIKEKFKIQHYKMMCHEFKKSQKTTNKFRTHATINAKANTNINKDNYNIAEIAELHRIISIKNDRIFELETMLQNKDRYIWHILEELNSLKEHYCLLQDDIWYISKECNRVKSQNGLLIRFSSNKNM